MSKTMKKFFSKEKEETKKANTSPSVMIKVKFLKAHQAFAYSTGDIGIVSSDRIDELLKGEYVVEIN